MARDVSVGRWVAVALHVSLAVGGLMLLAVAGSLTASAVADVVTTTTASTTTPTTTAPVAATTSAATTSAATTTAATTTAATTTAATTTVATVTTAAPARVPLTNAAVTDRALASGCPAGTVAVVRPGRVPGLIGPVATTAGDDAVLDGLRYAVDGPVFVGADVRVTGGGCGSVSRVSIGSVSLFGGALSAASISLEVGRHDERSITGLRAGDASVSASSTRWHPLERWGRWRVGPTSGTAVAALTIRLLRPHAGLPAGTKVLVAVAGSPPKAAVPAPPRRMQRQGKRKQRRKGTRGMPLRVTPPLEVSHEIFPVVGAEASFSDTYGALRTDVAGNWHHGDDIFAPLGTPVVAVAAGTVNRVGWNPVGGWRLWVRDGAGDEFYYAHLSGYTRAILHSKRVRAGEVIGFVGNTGDAFTTPPHLHFEIHPRPLLHLGYNGAIDPTRYLEQWTHLDHVRTPKPAHPALPTQPAVRAEARQVWRELLSARHLVRRPAVVKARTELSPTFPLQMSAASAEAAAAKTTPQPRESSASPALDVVLPLMLLTGLATTAVRYRRRRTS